jgi:hypothetical protein
MVPYATLKMVGLPCRLVSLAVAMAATGSPVAMSKDVGPRMLPAASAGVNVVHVSPGHLHRCAAAAAAAQRAADTSGGGRVATTRCVLSGGSHNKLHSNGLLRARPESPTAAPRNSEVPVLQWSSDQG